MLYKLSVSSGSFILIIFFLISACKKEGAGSCFMQTGDIAKESRNLMPFDSVRLERRMNLMLIPDTVNFVSVEAGKNLMNQIQTEQNGGFLIISNKNRCNWVRSYEIPVNIYLHFTGFKHIVSYGTSKITSSDTIRTDEFTIEFRDASTDLNLLVSNRRINIIQHTGASDVIVKGNTEDLSVYMASLAYGDYRNLQAKTVYVESRSAADCIVNATDSYVFKLRAAGNIYYKGSAPVLDKEVIGSGSLIKVE